jgi:radical SAM protein with 4Fe4S-binding SPASM domain
MYSKVWMSFRNFKKILFYGTVDVFDEIAIETTTYCNRACSYCPNSVFNRGEKKNEKLMDERLFKKIIDELSVIKYKGSIYPYFYGEPLLDERLANFMDYAHKKLPEAKIVVSTNGDYLSIQMLDKLYDAGVRSFCITIHGDIREGTKRIKDLMKYIKITRKKINILSQVMNTNTALSTRIGLVKVKKVRQDDFYCLAPLCINYKGNVLLCGHDYLGMSNIFGNVEKEKVMGIWQKENFKEVRKQLAIRKYVLDICKKCADSH